MSKRYRNSVVYGLICKDKNVSSGYVGSSRRLNYRMNCHKSKCIINTKAKLYEFIMKNGGWENWSYVILEYCKNINNKKELQDREQYWFDMIKPDLNSRRANGVNIEQIIQTKKQWCQENKDKIVEYKKQYYKDNIDKTLEHNKQYYKNNRNKILETNKKRYQDNKNEMIEKYKKTVPCDNCGTIIVKQQISRHKKTKKCINYKN